MEVKDENGSNFIPASQRPDGTWRKPRRVKEGYVPQEEVPLYESKGKQFLNRKAQQKLPPGFAEAPDVKPKRIPGYTVEEKPKKDKKKSKTAPVVEGITKSLSEIKLEEPAAQDPVKKLKNLKKRLREIEALELKINAGDIKNPEKEQLDKVGRKKEVIKEIRIIEASIPSDK